MMAEKKLPPWALVVLTLVAIVVLCALVSLAVDFDLPAWAQRVLTCIGLSALVAFLAMPHVGVALVRAAQHDLNKLPNPDSAHRGRLPRTPEQIAAALALDWRWTWGVRFVSWGIAGRDALEKVAGALSPAARRILESFPEAEVPSGVAATVNVEQGASLTVRQEPGSQVVTEPAAGTTGIRKVPPLVVMGLALAGCHDLTYARSVRDASHDAALVAASYVEPKCVALAVADQAHLRTLPAGSPEWERFAEASVAERQRRKCPAAIAAYETLRVAAITLDASVAAAETGQCMASRAESCDVGGAAVKAAVAISTMAPLVEHLAKGSK
jgi:hypothetical protein